MTIELQSALRIKCDADGRLGLLFAQWEYDRRLVGQALNVVGYNFPHYSRHDASHSDNILLQITRVLGARVEQLSATDLWLILEAAYWHDSGMIVDAETTARWWRDIGFIRHLESLKDSADPMLVAAARIVSDQGPPKGDLWPLQVRKAVTLVLADYGRTQHAGRSGQAVLHPLLQGIESPRALIPQRLFHWLAEITVRHGGSFEEVMALPYEEAGLGVETCHPRFVAFMLRLGDLLDLDNGRFCDVMTRSIGTLPTSSLDHVGKHASIQHFSVSPEKVAVTAVCSDETGTFDPYGPYEAVSSWLDWLREELWRLAAKWVDIAPPKFGGAPSVGVIQAVLNGYISLELGKRPKFSFDEPAFLKLVRSNNLYRSRFAWVRELMTNAEDATLIRLHHEVGIPPLDHAAQDPYQPVREAVARFPLKVVLLRDRDGIQVEIHDQGTGISKADLRYMLSIGSSQRNPERRAAVRAMPEHARPTGNFGIGLQSVFMATNEVEMSSMHVRTGDRLHIRIRRSAGADAIVDVLDPAPERAGVYIKPLKDGEPPKHPGTIIKFRIDAKPRRSSLEESGGGAPDATAIRYPGSEGSETDTDDGRFTKSSSSHAFFGADFDPVHAEQPGGELERLIAEFKALARTMIATVLLETEELHEPEVLQRSDENSKVMIFDQKTDLMFKFRGATRSENPIHLTYRGAPVVEHGLPPLPILDVEVNAEFGRAVDVVAASRETLTPEGEHTLSQRVREGLENVFANYERRLATRDRQVVSSSSDVPQLVSLFGKVYLEERFRESPVAHLWRDVQLIKSAEYQPVALRELETWDGLGIFESRLSRAPHGQAPRTQARWCQIGDDGAREVARDALLSLFPQVRLVGITASERRYLLSRAAPANAAADEAGVVDALMRELSYLPTSDSPQRVIWPLLKGFEPLKLDTGGAVRFRRSRRMPRWVLAHDWLVRWVMVLPFEFRAEGEGMKPRVSLRHLESYAHWVREHCEPTGESEAQRTRSIIDAGQELVLLLHRKLSEPVNDLCDFEGEVLTSERVVQQLKEQFVRINGSV